MATHCSILAWRIPWTEELQFMGSQRVRLDWSKLSVSVCYLLCYGMLRYIYIYIYIYIYTHTHTHTYESDIHTFQRGSSITEILVFLSQIMVIPFKNFRIKYRPTVWTEYEFPLSSHSLLSVVLTAVTLPSCKTIFWSCKLKDRLTYSNINLIWQFIIVGGKNSTVPEKQL